MPLPRPEHLSPCFPRVDRQTHILSGPGEGGAVTGLKGKLSREQFSNHLDSPGWGGGTQTTWRRPFSDSLLPGPPGCSQHPSSWGGSRRRGAWETHSSRSARGTGPGSQVLRGMQSMGAPPLPASLPHPRGALVFGTSSWNGLITFNLKST